MGELMHYCEYCRQLIEDRDTLEQHHRSIHADKPFIDIPIGYNTYNDGFDTIYFRGDGQATGVGILSNKVVKSVSPAWSYKLKRDASGYGWLQFVIAPAQGEMITIKLRGIR